MKNKINNLKLTMNKRKNGFTRIKFLAILVIIAVVIFFIFSNFNPLIKIQKGNDDRRKSDLAQIQKSLDFFYKNNGKYPFSTKKYEIKRLDETVVTRQSPSWFPYMNTVPFDLNMSKNYVYYANPSGQSYWLYASLDLGTKDPQACNNGSPCKSLPINEIPISACGGICNYGVSSPNASP